jgi:hypothetical protein
MISLGIFSPFVSLQFHPKTPSPLLPLSPRGEGRVRGMKGDLTAF